MFLSTMQTLPFTGRNMAYQCKGLDQSNSVYEYEVIRSTNEKVISDKAIINTFVSGDPTDRTFCRRPYFLGIWLKLKMNYSN